jgi:NAD+ synthase (glutamine-hydrolysing)
VRMCANAYADEVLDIEIDGENHEEYVEDFSEDRDVAELYNGLVYGIDRFMKSIGKKNVVIGLSGGIDSAVVACLFSKVLGKDHVYAVNMPSKFNSTLTQNAAIDLANNLGINYTIFPIQNTVNLTIEELNKTVFTQRDGSGNKTNLDVTDFVIENIQARDRGSRVLAGIAASLGAVFTNNGNKTETTVGYCTLYGDLDGAISPIADLWKFEVYQLADYINHLRKTVIPNEIINVVPSAELSASQDVTQGKGDPIIYPYHDKLFRAFVEFRFDPEKILDLYSEGTLEGTLMMERGIIKKYFPTNEAFINDLERWWKLYKISVFKRIQSPPIIAVSRRAFGFDLRETQLQSSVYYSQRYSLTKTMLLNK